MISKKIDARSERKPKKIFLIALLLFFAVIGTAEALDLGYDKELAALRARFETITSLHHIDAFIRELDRFERRFPHGKSENELQRVRAYVNQLKSGIPLRVILVSVSTTKDLDIANANDIFVVIAGPMAGERETDVAEDTNNPIFNFPIDFVWKINSSPFIFDVNDKDETTFERIGSIVVPCNGITGWRNLDRNRSTSLSVSVLTMLSKVPDCPW